MKKFLMVAALVGMVAAPAFAGLAPEAPSNSEITPYTMGGPNPRSAAYAPNDANHVYDGMTTEAAGPEDLIYQLRQNVASSAICELINLRPGATQISSIHMIIDNRLGAAGARTMSIAFRNNVGGAAPVGSFLTTASLGFSAWYVFGAMPFGAINLMTFNLGNFDANVTNTSIWMCLQANYDFRVRGGGFSGNETHGNPGDGTPTSLYIGSGSGVMASLYPGGGGIGSASIFSTFTLAFTTGTRLGAWHAALGGTPEPTTAALLGLLGLVALRRRKVKA